MTRRRRRSGQRAYTPVISPSFLKARPAQICAFSKENERHTRCPSEWASVCGLRQGAVSAGGSQTGILRTGASAAVLIFFVRWVDSNGGSMGPTLHGSSQAGSFRPGGRQTPAPSGYSSASLSSRASVSTVVPARFQAPSVSKRRSPMRRPHGAMTRPIARKSLLSAWS